jgi:serine protease AprX
VATITSPTSNVTVNPGQSIFFSGAGSNTNETITAFSWTFPGGNPASSSLATPGNVTYSTPGTYAASLTVKDSTGLTNPTPATRAITVSDFSMAATPGSRLVLPGGSTNYSATTTAGPGFTGTITFSVSGLPSGSSATFSSNSVNGSGSTTMHITTGLLTSLGSHQLTITGNSGGLAHSATVTLSVGVPLSLP